MKKVCMLVALVLIMISFGACFFTAFDGNRTGNTDALILDYNILNRTESQMLELEEGDIVDFDITSVSGKIDIVLQNEGDDPSYKGTSAPTSSFAVEIVTTGEYEISVTGENARGSVSIMKRVDH